MWYRHDMNCGALILAAGASRRLGHPKQLVVLDGETLLERSVRIAREAGCIPIVVVLGAFAEQILDACELGDTKIVLNSTWSEGMGTSLSVGIRAFHEVSGVLVMTCDMPAVTTEHLCALAASGTITASCYANRNGVPAYFPRDLFPEILDIHGDTGAREILRAAPGLELPGGSLDVDTTEDLAEVKRRFASDVPLAAYCG